MIPDLEVAVRAYLLAIPAVTTLTSRVVTTTPANKDTAWVKLTQLDGVGDVVDHLVSYLLQIDVYASKANTRGEASLLARTVRAAMGDMPGGVYSGATVTGVQFTGHQPMPDADGFEPARERYVLTAEVWAHAT